MTSPLLPALVSHFQRIFQAEPSHLAQAPGRVNLIGEHTDYNDGFVLPCAIDFHTLVAGRARDDGLVRVYSQSHAQLDSFSLHQPIALHPQWQWPNYVRGVVRMLQARGLTLQGADLAISGDVPQGAGLSSSASLEVAVAQCFKSLCGLAVLTPTDLAQIGQAAENEFVGCQCGIMDQLVSARGERDHALLIDCRSLAVRAVPLPPELAVMIIHSRVQRGLVESEYNTRRQQCEAAARHFGVLALRDVDLPSLTRGAQGLDPVSLRRACHVVTENQRTLDAAEALQGGDLPRLFQLMAQSHESMRDDFEITVPAIDRLVELVQGVLGPRGGVRMTGGGFGGCVVALLPRELCASVRAAIAAGYRSPQGEAATVYLCQASAGAAGQRLG